MEYNHSITARLKNGDNQALSEIVALYGDRLLRGAYLIMADETGAQDIVQEVFITAYYRIGSFKGDASLYTWLYRIMVNKCRESLRSSWWKKVVLFERPPEPAEIAINADDMLLALDVTDIIRQLPLIYREVITLYYYEDMSTADIAGILNCRQATIRSRLLRARNILKPILAKEGFIDEG